MRLFIYPLFLLALLSCDTDSAPSQPNIILIMADDLGYGDISCYGSTIINTPNVDALAESGVMFLDFHSNGSVCSPTRAALLTGKYQQRTGVEAVITAKNHREVGMSLEEETLAEEMKKLGYHCGMFGKWHLGYDKQFNPTLQGFDEFVGYVSGNVDYHAHIDQEGYLDWWQGTTIDNEEGYVTDLITAYGINFIKENDPGATGKPFFLYLPHEAPHSPYQRRMDGGLREVGKPGTRAVEKDSIPSIYKEMVEVMDEGVGKVMKAIEEIGQKDNTIVVFISDNGANAHGDNGGLRGFKGGVYEGGSRVPAIISYPDQIRKGEVSDETVLTMDLLPTLLDFCGVDMRQEDLDGISIREHLVNDLVLPPRDAFFSYNGKSFIRSENWKLIRIEDESNVRIELYDLAQDLQESNDLSHDHPEMVTQLLRSLMAWHKEVSEGVVKVSG